MAAPELTVFFCPGCELELTTVEGGTLCPGCLSFYPKVHGFYSFLKDNGGDEGFKGEHFDILNEVEERHFWHQKRKQLIWQLLKKHCPGLSNGLSMLEIGCGSGSVLAFLKRCGVDVEGGDIFPEALTMCREKAKVPLYHLDARHLPFRNRYDVVGVFDVLEHIEEDEKALRQIWKALKYGGKIVVTVPANKRLWSSFDLYSCHKRRYSKREIKEKLERSGFIVEWLSHYMIFLFPLAFLWRRMGSVQSLWAKKASLSKPAGTIPLQMKPIPVMNFLFSPIVSIENFLLKYFPLPYGTSLVAVARKAYEKHTPLTMGGTSR